MIVGHEIKLIDATAGLRELSNRSVDLIITDPAYDSLEKARSIGTTTRLKKWFKVVPDSYYADFFTECSRVLRNRSLSYVFCNEDTGDAIKPSLRENGFRHEVGCLYWRKVGKPKGGPCSSCGHVERSPGSAGTGYPFRKVVEKIFIGRKGPTPMPINKSVRDALDIEDVELPLPTFEDWLEYPAILKRTCYPTEKPVALLEILIQQATLKPNSLIVDPFAGSGSTGEAAFNLGHRFLGFDIDKKSLKYFESRKSDWKIKEDSNVESDSEYDIDDSPIMQFAEDG